MTQAQWCKFRCFFAQNWRPLLPNCIRAIFKKRKNRRNWRPLLAKKIRGRGFELKWRCFVRVPWVLPRAEKKTRVFEKTEKKSKKVRKKRDFVEENKGFNNKSAKIREAGRPGKKKHKNAFFGHFREDLGSEDLG